MIIHLSFNYKPKAGYPTTRHEYWDKEMRDNYIAALGTPLESTFKKPLYICYTYEHKFDF